MSIWKIDNSDPLLEEFKIVLIREASPPESVSHCKISLKIVDNSQNNNNGIHDSLSGNICPAKRKEKITSMKIVLSSL